MLLRKHTLSASFLLGLSLSGSAFAAGLPEGETIARNTPKFVNTARVMGKVEPGTIMEVSIWLKPHDQAGLDALVKELYDPTSPKYRKFLTRSEYAARFAPTEAEANKVAQFFAAKNMKVVKVGPDNFFVRASGTAAAVSAAFHVNLNNYEVNGRTLRANAEDPYIEGEAAALVHAVAGLDNVEYEHPIKNWKTALTKAGSGNESVAAAVAAPKSLAATDVSPALVPASSFNSNCFPSYRTEMYTTDGALPAATYRGMGYTHAPAGCGYTPKDIATAYNLNALYAQHLDGTGQTIVIIDSCGSPTIQSDANAFSAQFGLPALTSKNFQIINAPTPSYCSAADAEINLDVEWSHAIAPGANIDLVIAPSDYLQDLDEALFYAVDEQLGNSLSGSYGSEELYTSPTYLITEDLISEFGSVLGISLNFSSGDDGDYTFDYPQYNAPSVSAPASSPYATAVGGVSLALRRNGAIYEQLGWGTNANQLVFSGEVEDPPSEEGFFVGGSGGGESGFFEKPYFQDNLPGLGRQLPDISWLADPYTGGYIAISEPFAIPELQYESIGGTSLACPMFSALWAIANQAAGQPLGQAAPYLYGMPKGTITDIVARASSTNVTGVVTDSAGTTSYDSKDLADPLEVTPQFISTIWDYPLEDNTVYLLTFGTDSGLKVTKGWDNVTGLGVPDPVAFINAFKPAQASTASAR